MAHTYISDLIHCVFSTKHRQNTIPSHLQTRLCSFLGGIARKNGFKAIAVGGTQNHAHILLSLSPVLLFCGAGALARVLPAKRTPAPTNPIHELTFCLK